MFSLKDKVAVVTGGSIGLGAQIAEALAEAGASVVITARRVERCESLAGELKEKYGVSSLAVGCDVSKFEDCKVLVQKTVDSLGRLDILVNNAGITWAADAMDYPLDKWEEIIATNLTGVFQLSMLAARVMKEQKRGKIINISSLAGLGGTLPEAQNTVAYNVSKGGLITLTKDLAVKWARYGIYVNAIAPGFFPTHMSSKLLEKNKHLVLPRIPLNRLGGENDLKGAVVFLSSSASDYITGHCLVVDGGMTALV